MKKIVLAASLLLISATAHAGTYSVEGVTVHVRDGCMSARCVSVNAPGYGYYDGATNRGGWARYFAVSGVRVAWWSASTAWYGCSNRGTAR